MNIALTGAMFHAIAPRLDIVHADNLAALHNEICPLYKIDTAARLQAFIPQEAHESAFFTAKAENLNYSAESLLKVFGKYFTPASAQAATHKPEVIANIVYDNRMGNGNAASGDGWKHRGGGFIQLTGKDMYEKYAAYKGMPVDQIIALVRTEDRWAIDSACWLFAVEKKLLDEADRGDIVTIRKRINGGTIGLDDCIKLTALAKQVIV